MTKKHSLKSVPPLKAKTAEELAAMPDEEINTDDILELGDEFWKNARLHYPSETKEQLTPDFGVGNNKRK